MNAHLRCHEHSTVLRLTYIAVLSATVSCARPLPTSVDTETESSTDTSTASGTSVDSNISVDSSISADSNTSFEATGATETGGDVESAGTSPEPICGNEVVEAGELCDDGNNDDGDGCSADCLEIYCLVPMTHPTVQEGVDDANCATVWVLAGTYSEMLTIGRDVELRPADSGEVEIDAGGLGRPVTVTAGTVVIGPLRLTGGVALEGGGVHTVGDLTLEGTEVSGNQALGSDEEQTRGGGVFLSGGTLVLVGARINTNAAISTSESYGSAEGGGIFSYGGNVLLSADSEVSDNQALSIGQGGSATCGGICLFNSSFEMSGGFIEANHAESTNDRIGFVNMDSRGGGLYLYESSAVFDNVTIRDNAALAHGLADSGSVYGGGLFVGGDSQVTMSFTSMIGNRAEAILTGPSAPDGFVLASAEGGGIYGRVGTGTDTVEFDLTDCSLEGNRASATSVADGGAIFSLSDARGGAAYLTSGTGESLISLRLNRSLVADSSVEGQEGAQGGAIYAGSGTGESQTWLIAVNSTFSGNAATAATAQGGAMFFSGGISLAYTRARLFNVTVTENLADEGGGLYSYGDQLDIEFGSSIVQGNVAALDADLACLYGGSTVSAGHNITGSTGGCSVMGEGDSVGQDAMLLPLAYNGGPTRTHALEPMSPARNGGNPLGCTDPDGVALTVDQRREVRPAEMSCDVGAFEHQP